MYGNMRLLSITKSDKYKDVLEQDWNSKRNR